MRGECQHYWPARYFSKESTTSTGIIKYVTTLNFYQVRCFGGEKRRQKASGTSCDILKKLFPAVSIPPIIVSKIVWFVYAVILSGMKSWFHDHHHAIETMQSRVHDMSSLWRPSLCYLCYHIFSIFCYISMTTAATADLKKTQNVRKVELHTAYMRKIGTFVWREKPDPHHQPYHSSTHLKCTQMI